MAGQYKAAQETADAIAAAWEKITDQIGRDSQIALYKASLGTVMPPGRARAKTICTPRRDRAATSTTARKRTSRTRRCIHDDHGDLLHVVPASTTFRTGEGSAGHASGMAVRRQLIAAGTLLFLATVAFQLLYATGVTTSGFASWRPVFYAYFLWALAIIFGQVLVRGERGKRAAFVLPAVFFTVALVIFPTVFGLYLAFTDWNLSSVTGRKFNGFDNLVALWNDPFYWNAMLNMVYYVIAVFFEYAIAFGLALLLNSEIRARRFFRVVFLLPFMLSPVAVSWMVGKSIMENRFGPLARFARFVGWENPAFFSDPGSRACRSR
jgi:hypothetical protein